MLSFRMIVVLDDTHVADRPHEGVAGLVLAAPTDTSSRRVER